MSLYLLKKIKQSIYKTTCIMSEFQLLFSFQALGNHEFDRQIEGLLPFLQRANFPVLSANIDTAPEPSIAPHVSKSYIAQVGGQQIGLVGYITKDTTIISSPGKD
jgi:5'-nucleotidase